MAWLTGLLSARDVTVQPVNGSSVVSVAERLYEPGRVRRSLSWVGPSAYAVALSVMVISDGVTLSRSHILVWIVLGLLAFSLTNVRGWIRGVVLEWLPFALILSAYDLLRGHADNLLFSAHVRPQLRLEEILFFGSVPTVWLQERLWDGAGNLHWYDYAACVVYLSYFVATYLVAGFLWFSARSLFRRYVAMVLVLALMGFATYALFPAAPPWLASHYGELDPTTRSIAVIWREIPVVHVNTFFEEGSRYANPVAAVPSLHAAYTLLITLDPLAPGASVGAAAARRVPLGDGVRARLHGGALLRRHSARMDLRAGRVLGGQSLGRAACRASAPAGPQRPSVRLAVKRAAEARKPRAPFGALCSSGGRI